MSIESTYNGKPTMLWVVVLIVAGVGLYYTISGLLSMLTDFSFFGADLTDLVGSDIADMVDTLVGGIYLVLGVLTLLIAFLVYSGSKGGRTFLVIILVISILGNVFSLIVGDITGILWLVLALVTFILLYRPEVKEYFKA